MRHWWCFRGIRLSRWVGSCTYRAWAYRELPYLMRTLPDRCMAPLVSWCRRRRLGLAKRRQGLAWISRCLNVLVRHRWKLSRRYWSSLGHRVNSYHPSFSFHSARRNLWSLLSLGSNMHSCPSISTFDLFSFPHRICHQLNFLGRSERGWSGKK